MQKKTILQGILLVGMSLSLLACSNKSEYTNEAWYDKVDVVEINRELPHASFLPYPNKEMALENEKSVFTKDYFGSPYVQSLNGTWEFYYANSPKERLSDPDDPNIQWGSLQDTIEVPCNVELQRKEDGSFKYGFPIYTNYNYPWGNFEEVDYETIGKHPIAPTVVNGVSHFRREFTIDESWQDKAIFVSFQGVESAFYLYVNGQFVGYGEDSYTVDEFNITKYLNPVGQVNTMAVQVYRWSTGSYLENQDFIRLSGIFRDVYLQCKDEIEIRDFFVKPSLNDAFDEGVVDIEVDLRNTASKQNVTIKASLFDEQDVCISEVETEGISLPTMKGCKNEGKRVTVQLPVVEPKLWSDEVPNLYRCVIELVNEDNEVVETVCQRVGFRRIENVVINEDNQHQMQLNGKKLMIRGINRHEASFEHGRALTKEEIEEDLILLKQHNINAIRTSHYPNNIRMYDYADELGLLICDEVNIESHKGAFEPTAIPSGRSIFKESVLQRTKNMVERDKNHPSVIIYSLGNEATYSHYRLNSRYCFYESTKWILERDPSRIRKYERDNRYKVNRDGSLNRKKSMVDVYSSQYFSIEEMMEQITTCKLPYIQSEYAHSMGNADGNLKEYWDVFRSYDNAQGGFIWVFKDQGHEVLGRLPKIYDVVSKNGIRGRIDGELVDGRNGTKAVRGAVVLNGPIAFDARSTKGMSLDCYVRLDGEIPTNASIVGKGDDGYNLKFDHEGNLETFFDGYLNGTLKVQVPSDFNDGTWKRLTSTIDESGLVSLYYNGTLLKQKQVTVNEVMDTNGRNIGIGYDSQHVKHTFNGDIDSVRIVSHCMKDEEIQNGMVNEDYVVGFDFDEGEVQLVQNDDVVSYIGYGGDFGDEVLNDGAFCSNGIFSAKKAETAKSIEVKKVLQEVNFKDFKDGKVTIVNEYADLNLDQFEIVMKVKQDGKLVEERILPIVLEPRSEMVYDLGLDVFDTETLVEFYVVLKNDTNYAKKGFVQAMEQFVVEGNEEETFAMDGSFAEVIDDLDQLKVVGSNFEVVFSKHSGLMNRYIVDGTDLLVGGPKLNLYRARIDNDAWEEENYDLFDTQNNSDVSDVKTLIREDCVELIVQGNIRTQVLSPYTTTYTIYPNGMVKVKLDVTVNGSEDTTLKRVGMKMDVDQSFKHFTYYGKGPYGNYVDRKSGSLIDLYAMTVQEMDAMNVYQRPQSNGNHSDVRFVCVSDADSGLLVVGDHLNMSYSQYEEESYDWMRHMYEVKKAPYNVLRIDLAQKGLGNASYGPKELEQYALSYGSYSYSYVLCPYNGEDVFAFYKQASSLVNAR